MRRMWWVATLVLGMFLVSCKEEPKPAPAPKQEAAKAPQAKPAETKPAEVKPAETKPAEVKPAEVKPAETKPAETKPAESKPAAAEELAGIEKALGAAPDGERLTDALKSVQEWQSKNAGAPELPKALVLAAKLRVTGLLLGASGKVADLDEKVLMYDGKLAAGTETTPDLMSQYMRGLAGELQKQAASLQGPEKDQLMAYAALLAWQADDILEATGKVAGSKLDVPKEWLLSDTPVPAAVEEPAEEAPEAKPAEGAPAAAAPEAKPAEAPAAKAEEKPAEAVAAKAEEKPAEARPAEAKPAEEVKADAAAGTAQQGEAPAEAKPADAAAPAAPAAVKLPPVTITAGGADPATLLALIQGNGPVALEARYVLLLKIRNALKAGAATTEIERWFETADGMGKFMCAACGQFRYVKPEFRRFVVFAPTNSGIVCPEAKAAIEGGTAAPDAVAASCAALFGLAAEDTVQMTAVNALALRTYTFVLEQTAAVPGEGFMITEVNALATETKGLLKGMLALYPPLRGLPKETWEAMKDKLVLRSDLNVTSPAFGYMPLEIAVADETNVSGLMRPVVQTGAVPFQFAEKATGYGWPGKNVGTLEATNAEKAEKDKALKEKKVPYLDFFNAYVEELVVKGVKFDKPDYSVPSLVAAAGELFNAAVGLEPNVYAELKDKAVVNAERPNWPNYADTVGKALLVAVDHKAPVLLMKRMLDSWFHADYKDMRLVKGTGCLGTVPTVYYTEKFLDDSVLDTTYKRPVLVYVTSDNTVNFYPPTTNSARSKMTAKRSPSKRSSKWPGKFKSIYDPRNPDDMWNLFMSYTSEADKDFEAKVADIARQMQRKWDNGNVFYLMAHEKADSGLVVKVADILTHLPGKPVKDLAKAFPGFECDAEKGPQYCPTNIVVLFPEVEIPYLPGKVKVQEVAQNAHCDFPEIKRRIDSKKGGFKFCYDPELQKNANLKGKVTFKVTIGAEGRVTNIVVGNDGLGNRNVVDCSTKVIKQVQFPRSIGGVCEFSYTYVFTP